MYDYIRRLFGLSKGDLMQRQIFGKWDFWYHIKSHINKAWIQDDSRPRFLKDSFSQCKAPDSLHSMGRMDHWEQRALEAAQSQENCWVHALVYGRTDRKTWNHWWVKTLVSCKQNPYWKTAGKSVGRLTQAEQFCLLAVRPNPPACMDAMVWPKIVSSQWVELPQNRELHSMCD